jgi:hypothetical protein
MTTARKANPSQALVARAAINEFYCPSGRASQVRILMVNGLVSLRVRDPAAYCLRRLQPGALG